MNESEPNTYESMEIDFLPVTSETGEGTTKSGDAIVGRLFDELGQQKVFVVDAGFRTTGEAVLAHLDKFYDTDVVDLAVSTHPDADHLNGLQTVVEQGHVGELLIHQPREHTDRRLSEFSNLEAVDDLLAAARVNGTTVSSPFTGERRLDGHLVLLGPDKDFYEQTLDDQLDEVAAGEKSFNFSSAVRGIRNLLDSAVGALPFEETLTDLGETTPRNESSVVTLIRVGAGRVLLTGDAGREGLARAADEYERIIGTFQSNPLWVFQAPHHGSRRNVGPTLLNRVLGPRNAPWGQNAIISAGQGAPKHPSAKVVNALSRRCHQVLATRGTIYNYPWNTPRRTGWSSAQTLPPLREDHDDD